MLYLAIFFIIVATINLIASIFMFIDREFILAIICIVGAIVLLCINVPAVISYGKVDAYAQTHLKEICGNYTSSYEVDLVEEKVIFKCLDENMTVNKEQHIKFEKII